jgi:hypothetical protein
LAHISVCWNCYLKTLSASFLFCFKQTRQLLSVLAFLSINGCSIVKFTFTLLKFIGVTQQDFQPHNSGQGIIVSVEATEQCVIQVLNQSSAVG